jgi:DNA-binding XRE family transcriptional regulator
MDRQKINELYKRIGLLIAKARRSRKGTVVTQAQLAEHIGISRTSMVNIERGHHKVSIHHLYTIAESLGVSVIDLLPDEDTRDVELPREVLNKLKPSERKYVENVIRPILKEVKTDEPTENQRKSEESPAKIQSKKSTNSRRKDSKRIRDLS